MKKLIVLCILILFTLTFAHAQSKSNPQWITDVYIVSPEKLDRIGKGSVLIENGRIARVERKRHQGAQRSNGHLWTGTVSDAWVHRLACAPGFVPWNGGLSRRNANPAIVHAYLKQMPRSYLYYGYTTLVDLAVGDPQLLRDFRNEPLHPDLYDCGGSLPFANGYPMSFAPPGVRFKTVPKFHLRSETGRQDSSGI